MCLSFFSSIVAMENSSSPLFAFVSTADFFTTQFVLYLLEVPFYFLETQISIISTAFPPKTRKKCKIHEKKIFARKASVFAHEKGKQKKNSNFLFDLFFNFPILSLSSLPSISPTTDVRMTLKIGKCRRRSKRKLRAFRDFLSLPKANLAEIKIFT